MRVPTRLLAAISFVLGLALVALCLIFPAVLEVAVQFASSLIDRFHSVLPIAPLLLYVILGAVIWNFLWEAPRDLTAVGLDRDEASSLTLTGFCFTSLSFLLAFFKTDIQNNDPAPQKILFFFACALGCFIASYMVLRFRTENVSLLLNQALIDNGLWCVLVGFWTFFTRTTALRSLTTIFTIFIVLYFVYLVRHLVNWIRYCRRG